MVSQEYAIAYSEVLEILKYIPEEDFKKIPNDKIELYELNADTNYEFNYNPKRTLDEQNVSRRAKAIIGLLFRDYWATPIQKEKIIAKQKYERNRLEEEKSLKYNTNNIFKNKIKQEDNIFGEQVSMIEYKDSIIKKIMNKIKRLFKHGLK